MPNGHLASVTLYLPQGMSPPSVGEEDVLKL